jgi:hypothetical protein
MQQARERLSDAEAILGAAHPAVVVSAAYYGMLYAARAALWDLDLVQSDLCCAWPVRSRPECDGAPRQGRT